MSLNLRLIFFCVLVRAALTSLVDAPDVDAEVEKQLNAENDMDIQ